jgi:hypothetical protein
VVGRDIFADAAMQVAAAASQVAESAKSADVDVDEVANIDRKAVKEKGIAAAESSRKAVTQFRDDLEQYLREKFPKQRRDAVINRLKKVIQDIQQNPEFQETIDFTVDLVRRYATRVKESIVKEEQEEEPKPYDDFEIALKDFQV